MEALSFRRVLDMTRDMSIKLGRISLRNHQASEPLLLMWLETEPGVAYP